ncbi:uncharacterized protein cenpt isoform X2 [Festucalex cinctus]
MPLLCLQNQLVIGFFEGQKRSTRLRNKVEPAQTPRDLIKRSMRDNLRQSISRQPVSTRKRTASSMQKKATTPSPTSSSTDDNDTPRRLLKKILQTEPVKSPAVHEEAARVALQLPAADSSIASKRQSLELDTSDLSNVTFGAAASVAKGLKRKRPARILSVTAFEEHLNEGRDDAVNERDELAQNDSSLSLSNITSLSLKTPFVDDRNEKKGLRRRVSHRQRSTKFKFGDAEMELDHDERDKSAQNDSSLSLSNITSLSLKTPFVDDRNEKKGLRRRVSLRQQSTKFKFGDAEMELDHGSSIFVQGEPGLSETAPDLSLLAAQDKSVVPGSSHQGVHKQPDVGRQLVESKTTVGDREDQVVISPSEGEGDVVSESQEEDGTQEEVEGAAVDRQTEEEDEAATCEDEEEAETPPEEEEADVDSQTEGVVDSQTEDDAASAGTRSEENNVAEDDNDGQQEEEDGAAENDDDDDDDDEEHIARRAHRSERALVVPVAEDDSVKHGRSVVKNGTQRLSDFHGLEDGQDADQDLSSHLVAASDREEPPEEALPTEVADPTEEEEEEEDGDDEDEQQSEGMKTPEFIREKITFQLPDPTLATIFKPQASTSAAAAPATKPKRARKRRSEAAPQGLSKSYLMSTFRHFAKAQVSADVYPVLRDTMEKFLERMAEDLETFANHAGRKTIEVEDAVLLLRRQGHVNDKVPVEVLIEKYLRLEQRKLLIPIATSGNVVVPKMKK